jgi:glutamine synthetase
MGLDMSYGDHEDAPGQLELNFRFDRARPDGGQHQHLPPDLQRGGSQARPARVVHAEAVHGVSANGHHHHFTL